jgi:hypothetical protein
MAGSAAGEPVVVRVVEEIKNAVGTCDWASPPVVDLRLGITADGSYVVVIREVVQCAFLNSERRAELVLSGPASKDLALSGPARHCTLSWGEGCSGHL